MKRSLLILAASVGVWPFANFFIVSHFEYIIDDSFTLINCKMSHSHFNEKQQSERIIINKCLESVTTHANVPHAVDHSEKNNNSLLVCK